MPLTKLLVKFESDLYRESLPVPYTVKLHLYMYIHSSWSLMTVFTATLLWSVYTELCIFQEDIRQCDTSVWGLQDQSR